MPVTPCIDACTGMMRKKLRKNGRRSKTLNQASVTRAELRMLKLLEGLPAHWRPTWRGQCGPATRGKICPYVSCKYHLYLDVNPETGSIIFNFPDLEVWEMEYCCALDVAEKYGITLEETGEVMNLTRERIRQIEFAALKKLRQLKDELNEE